MRRQLFTVIGFIVINLSTTTLFAQNIIKDGNISVRISRAQQLGDSLYIDMDIEKTGKNARTNQSVNFTPVLVAGSIEKSLPMVSLKGRNNYHDYYRSLSLMNKSQRARHEKTSPYIVVKDYKKGSSIIKYNLVIPYENWMSHARVDLRKDDCGCGRVKSTNVRLLANNIDLEKIAIIEKYVMTPYLSYITPEVEDIKRRDISTEAFLDFASGKTDIRMDYMNNPKELKVITDFMQELKDDKDIIVRSIDVSGYASPEGSFEGNKRLSEGRAKTLTNYLSNQFDYPTSMYRDLFGGENWTELIDIIKQSNISCKEQILSILSSAPDDVNHKNNTVLKRSLMNLEGGNAWIYMLKEYFPFLRKAVCKVTYEVKKFDILEAKEVFQRRPQNLSLNELFLIANTYEKGSLEFSDLFETAARLFPEDQTANLNAAISALERKDYATAERYLKKVDVRKCTPEYENALGVLNMMYYGNYDKAQQYFNSAIKAGLGLAKHNLEEIVKMMSNIEEIKQSKIEKQKRDIAR